MTRRAPGVRSHRAQASHTRWSWLKYTRTGCSASILLAPSVKLPLDAIASSSAHVSTD